MKKINPIFILALMTAVDMIGFGIIFPLLPIMQVKFGMDSRQLGYLASVFAVSGLVGTILFGYLSDKIGRKILLYVPFFLLSITYLMTAYATTYIDLLILRALGGFLSGNLSVAFAAASDISKPEDKFKNMGILGASFGLGFMFGPAIGGFLAGNSNNLNLVNLQIPFVFAFCITLVSGLIALLFFKESLSKKDRLEDKTSNVISSLIEVLKNKKILFFTYLSILLSLILSGVEVYLGPWLKDLFNFTSQDIGIYWGIFALCITISQLTLTRFLNAKTAIIIGFFVFSASQFMLLITNNLYLLGLNTLLMTFAMGIIFPSINVGISSEGAKNQQGLIFGINQSVGNIGRILGPYILGILYSYHPDYAWIFIGIISIITALFTLKFLQH